MQYGLVEPIVSDPENNNDEHPRDLDKLITCMYYALTTLSTVGYGDFRPQTVVEKIVGSIIQIIGVTFFSILMNQFIDVVVSLRGNDGSENELKLQMWFNIIRKIKNQPNSSGQDINRELKRRIEEHFRYYWDNDRREVLLDKKEYFDSIPFKIQEHIMCKFLFEDIIMNPAFKSFFRPGREFDSNFVYEVSFGFMPRQFKNCKEDRYIIMEEGDVTEIYFIVNGEWAIGFDSHRNNVPTFNPEEQIDFPPGTEDINESKIVIAKHNKGFGYIGDYYVFASKKAQFTYMALSDLDTYALPKQFMYKTIFKKFPGLHSEMVAESFSRYVKEFRRPVAKKRKKVFTTQNRKSQYSKVVEDTRLLTTEKVPKSINNSQFLHQDTKSIVSSHPVVTNDEKKQVMSKQKELQTYKEKLDKLNDMANQMFENMKEINKLVNKKIMEIEHAVTKSESTFVEEITKLIENKEKLQAVETKNKQLNATSTNNK